MSSEPEHSGEVSNMEKPPFPFRVAKALDPAICRNIEYDNWLEEKKAATRGM